MGNFDYINTFRELRASRKRFVLLTIVFFLIYVCGFIIFDQFVVNEQRYVLFAFGLVVSSLFFSWLFGGRAAFLYVTFFSLFFTFIYSKLLFEKGTLYASLFKSRSFIIISLSFVLLMILMLIMKSPTDAAKEKMEAETKEEKERTRLLEFLVTEKKITEDVVAQSNYAKDELLVLQGAWRSQIHNIINDLPDDKENDIYRKVIEPFQEAILRHLKGLEKKLTFEPEIIHVPDLTKTIERELSRDLTPLQSSYRLEFDITKSNGLDEKGIRCDPFKVVEIIRNLIKNAQKAIELKQIHLMKNDFEAFKSFTPYLSMILQGRNDYLHLVMTDNGGGLGEEYLDKIFKEPIPSSKRDGYGSGTTFVKFFSERMGFRIKARNVTTEHGKGFQTTVEMPFERKTENGWNI